MAKIVDGLVIMRRIVRSPGIHIKLHLKDALIGFRLEHHFDEFVGGGWIAIEDFFQQGWTQSLLQVIDAFDVGHLGVVMMTQFHYTCVIFSRGFVEALSPNGELLEILEWVSDGRR